MDNKLRSSFKKWYQEGTEDARLAVIQGLLRSGEARFISDADTRRPYDINIERVIDSNIYSVAEDLGLENVHEAGPIKDSLIAQHPLFPFTYFVPYQLDGKNVWLGLEWGPIISRFTRSRVGYWLVSDLEGFTTDDNLFNYDG